MVVLALLEVVVAVAVVVDHNRILYMRLEYGFTIMDTAVLWFPTVVFEY